MPTRGRLYWDGDGHGRYDAKAFDMAFLSRPVRGTSVDALAMYPEHATRPKWNPSGIAFPQQTRLAKKANNNIFKNGGEDRALLPRSSCTRRTKAPPCQQAKQKGSLVAWCQGPPTSPSFAPGTSSELERAFPSTAGASPPPGAGRPHCTAKMATT